jgi:hypothetical protein
MIWWVVRVCMQPMKNFLLFLGVYTDCLCLCVLVAPICMYYNAMIKITVTTSPPSEPIVYKMCEPRRLTTLWTSTVCYRDNFTFYYYVREAQTCKERIYTAIL